MRVAILTNDAGPFAQGGAGVIASLQATLLMKRGYEVRVWHVPMVWRNACFLSRILHHVRDLFPYPTLERDILDWQPDVVCTHNLTGVGFAVPARVASHGVRWIHVLHDVQVFEPSGQITHERVTAWQRFWSCVRGYVLGRPDLIISPTEWLLRAHLLRGLFVGIPQVVLPNPISVPAFFDEIRAPHVPLRALFVGRWRWDKGAEIVAQLMQSVPMVEWRLIGPGTENVVSPSGNGYGSQTPDQVFAAMQEADVLVVPSQIIENQPQVILEGLAHGLPIIASSIGGIPETMGEAGLCVSAQDIDGFVQALLNIQDKDAYKKLHKAAIAQSAQHDPEVYVEVLIYWMSKR